MLLTTLCTGLGLVGYVRTLKMSLSLRCVVGLAKRPKGVIRLCVLSVWDEVASVVTPKHQCHPDYLTRRRCIAFCQHLLSIMYF